MKNILEKSSTSTPTSSWQVSSGTSSSTLVSTTIEVGRSREPSKAQVENAVYGHIQAVRALGKDRITTADIAAALSLPHYLVLSAVQNLRDKGVYPVS